MTSLPLGTPWSYRARNQACLAQMLPFPSPAPATPRRDQRKQTLSSGVRIMAQRVHLKSCSRCYVFSFCELAEII
jgi:hypothetical protein